MSQPVRPADGGRAPGRDGISGLLSPGRAMRARDVSRPSPELLQTAQRRAEQSGNPGAPKPSQTQRRTR